MALKENNKFTLDFSDNKFVYLVNFSPKFDYYICSFNCDVNKANEVYNQTKTNSADELPQKSRELLSKGATYQNDIGYLTSSLTDNYYFRSIAPQKYSLVLDPKVVDGNSFKNKFFDLVDKKTKFAKIYSPCSHLKSGFLFKGDNDPVNSVLIKLVDDYKKIKSVYFQNIVCGNGYGNVALSLSKCLINKRNKIRRYVQMVQN